MRNGIIVFMLALGLGSLAPSTSLAGCTDGCIGVGHACMYEASMERVACRYDCKATGAPGCTTACSAAHAAARLACRTTASACKVTCATQTDPICADGCGDTADACADDPSKTLRNACYTACKAAAVAAKLLCAGDPACAIQVIADLGTCTHGCAAQIDAIETTCQGDFDTCLATCGG